MANSHVPKPIAVLGLGLAASSALPLTPDGQSFIDLLRGEFSRGLLEGLLMLAGFGSPYLFGLAVAVAVLWLPSATGRNLVRVPIAMMHSQLLLVALVLWSLGDVLAAPALLGFAVVGGLHFVWHSARTHAEAHGPTLAWYVRWGAVVVAGVAAWAKLQRLVDIDLGIGLDVILGCAIAMIVVLGRHDLREAADDRSPAPRTP